MRGFLLQSQPPPRVARWRAVSLIVWSGSRGLAELVPALADVSGQYTAGVALEARCCNVFGFFSCFSGRRMLRTHGYVALVKQRAIHGFFARIYHPVDKQTQCTLLLPIAQDLSMR